MIKEEFKNLLHNRLLLVVLAAIILIPSIYSGFFLSSMWDPYGDLKYLPVAVVNKDIPVEYKTKTLNVGEELADSLSTNDSMAFNIVDEETANNGLENGTYYMKIIIPEDFSKCASSVMDTDPKKMTLEYYTNPGKNYISMKLGESAVKEIKANIMKEVTTTYTEAVFDSLSDVADGFNDAYDGTKEMLDGEESLIEGNTTITENLYTLANGALTFKDGSSDLKDGLETYMDATYLINDGTHSLSNKLPEYTKGVSSAKSGSDKLVANNSAINDGVDKVANGVYDLKQGTTQLKDGLTLMQNSLDTSLSEKNVNDIKYASQSLNTLHNGISALNSAVNGDGNALDAMTASLTNVGSDIQSAGGKLQLAGSELPQAGTNLQTAAGNLTNAGTNLQNASNTLSAAGSNLANAAGNVTSAGANLQNAGTSIANVASDLNNAGTNLASASTKLNTSISNLGEVLTDINNNPDAPLSTEDIIKLQTAFAALYDPANGSSENVAGYLSTTGTNIANAGLGLNTAGDALTQAGASLNVAGSNMSDIKTNLESTGASLYGIKTDLENTGTNLNDLKTNLENTGTDVQDAGTYLTDAGQILTNLSNSDGIATLKSSIAQLSNGADQLLPASSNALDSMLGGLQNVQAGLTQTTANDGKAGLLEGISLVSNGLDTLYSKVVGENGLKSGIRTYTDGVKTLNNGLATLESHNGELNNGATKLANGTSELVANNETILSGIEKLNSGAVDISDGANKLADGSKELGEGLVTLQAGTKELNSALYDGSAEVKENLASDKNIDMFVSPVETDETTITKVENNGHAMAAYMLSVGLWVGCLAFCLMYPLVEYNSKLKNGFAWWASKAAVAYPVAIIMSLVAITVLHLFLGFNPESILKTAIVAIISAIAFMSIMYFFNILLGKVGSFIMLIFMVLQLAGSAGTYPIEVSGNLANSLHTYMPFTYTVDAFRSAISGGWDILPEMLILLGIMVVFTLLSILVFAIRGSKIKHNKKLTYTWIEEKGLA